MSAPGFLGRRAWVGSVVDLGAAPPTAFAGQASFTGFLVTSSWPRAEVAALLPPELELAESVSPMPPFHPVVFTFGDQHAGSMIFGGVAVEVGPTYSEFCMAVPFVRRRGGQSLQLFFPRMYSSSYPAYWHGNASYAMPKIMATMGWRGSTFAVAAPDGAPLVHAEVERSGAWRPAIAGDAPGFVALREAFALPIAGRRGDGSIVSSYFRWELDETRLRPAGATVEIQAPLVDGLGRSRRTGLPGGTFEVEDMVWKITWPVTRIP
jgi:hypothetical protein